MAELTRRQLVAAGLGGAGALVAGGGLVRSVWPMLAREDLVPGVPVSVPLQADAWTTTSDRLTFAAVGDTGSGGRQAMAVAHRMALTYRDAPFGVVSLLGDICYYGSIEDRFDEVFLTPFASLIDAGVGFELAIGNHDGGLEFRDPVLEEVEAHLALLGTPARFYSKVHGPAEFFYLDSSVASLYGSPSTEQLEWLDDALASSTRQWRIVCLHHPPYSSGWHGSTPGAIDRLVPIFERREVDLVLAGHDHHYERTVPLNGITYVVSGGGCKTSPVYGADFTAAARSTLQFVHARIDGDRLTGRCIAPDGTIVDRFTLRARR